MSDNKKSFLLYLDTLEIVEKLTDEQAGKLLKAFLAYHSGGDLELDPTLDLVFFSFQAQFERDAEKYQNIVERNKLNGSKGGRPKKQGKTKKPSGLSGNPTKPKKADSDSDSDSDSDTKYINMSVITDGFSVWWNSYPVSRRKNKNGCLNKFKAKVKKFDHEQFDELVNKMLGDTSRRIANIEDVKYLPMTEPYLNQERWLDGE